ncbi:MAG: hypothetical protein B6D63_03690 [Candidatus Latescibacteria bacterium 4484_7]|nr:MAG: hypothetical protein B6D63_03690 [Candidatus Latescibacteria bacterium 4484_7]
MMRSPVNDTIRHIKDDRMNAAYAFNSVLDKTLKKFDAIKDNYLKERAEDIRDVKRRVLRNIFGQRIEGLDKLRKKVIVVAKSLTPSDTAGLKKQYVQGIVTDRGGSTSHAAIIARSHGIPAVVGLRNFTKFVKPRDRLVVDGTMGQVVLRPSVETVKAYELAPESVIIRTLDVGGDKIARWSHDYQESNPFMGWRGIRFTLTRKDIFRTQLRAIYRASAHGSVRVMFPMISVVEEVIAAKEICKEVKEDLVRERYQVGDEVEIGIMIETPSSLGLDIDELSASPYLLPEIKKVVRSVTFDETRALAKKALQLKTADEVRTVIEKFISERRPELKELIPEATR